MTLGLGLALIRLSFPWVTSVLCISSSALSLCTASLKALKPSLGLHLTSDAATVCSCLCDCLANQSCPHFVQLTASLLARFPCTHVLLSSCLSSCRHASELRARLDQTAQARAQLASAVEALQRGSRQEDAAGVKHAIKAAQACGVGLLEDVEAAQQALDRWQLATNNEAKLAKALSNGTSVLALSRAVQVCSACV